VYSGYIFSGSEVLHDINQGMQDIDILHTGVMGRIIVKSPEIDILDSGVFFSRGSQKTRT
jgi:hypothetical protein